MVWRCPTAIVVTILNCGNRHERTVNEDPEGEVTNAAWCVVMEPDAHEVPE